ncbi:MAG: hypothetical protein ACREQY_20120 [Candidatus Binatia bacterium]
MAFSIGIAIVACRGGASDVGEPRFGTVVDLLARPPDKIDLETRQIRFGRGDRVHLVRGWSRDEWNPDLDVHYVWAQGRVAAVRFDVLEVRELQFLVELAPFPTSRRQRIGVFVNGHRVTRIDPDPGFLEYRFVVPADLLRRGKNTLVFRHREIGDDRRRLAAGYVSVLLGPNCLPLRPKGIPPEPTGVERTSQALSVRGPAELAYRLDVPAGAPRLRLRVEAGEEPARFLLGVDGGDSAREVAELRVSRPILGWSATRELSVDLSPWAGRTVVLRFAVYPEPCRSPFATAKIHAAEVLSESVPPAATPPEASER